jgi:hypothetical protein
MDAYPIRYEFRLDDGQTVTLNVRLNPKTLALCDPPPQPVPDWAKLGQNRCPGCALPDTEAHCPVAAHLAGVVESFSRTFSYVTAEVHVVTPEREYSRRSDIQTSLASLMGIYMVSSGCPALSALRPMVRFHLPFATELDTVYRAASMYLVAQFLRTRAGLKPDWELKGLAKAYDQIGEVNFAFASRLRHAVKRDANVNAVVLLDLFARAMPPTIGEGLEQLRDLFDFWLSPSSPIDP